MKSLRLVGVLYLLSGLLCVLQVDDASLYLGIGLQSVLAHSEFMTVYGGLQLGLAASMLLGSWLKRAREGVLFMSMILSCVLAGARIASFVIYPDLAKVDAAWVLLVLELGIALLLFVAYYKLLRSISSPG